MITTFLIVLIIGLIVSLIFLMWNFRHQKNRFHKKESRLSDTISVIKEKQETLNQQVKIADEFKVNYQKSNTVIAETIYEATVELLKKTVEKK